MHPPASALRLLSLLALLRAPEALAFEGSLDALVDSNGFLAERVVNRAASPIGELSLALTAASVRGTPIALLPAVASPNLMAGPLELTGTLRELADPLSGALCSGREEERWAIRLDGSLHPGARRGVVLSPFPSHLDLFWLQEEGGPAAIGGLVRAPLPAGVAGTLLLLASLPPEGGASASWFSDRPETVSPYLLHGGCRLAAGGSTLAAAIAGTLSLSPVYPPGGCLRATIAHTSTPLRVTGAIAIATPSYLLPDGRFPDRVGAGGLASELKLPFGRLVGSYEASLSRLPLLPVTFREHEQRGEIVLTAGENPISVLLRYAQERSATRVGRLIVDEELTGGLECNLDRVRLLLTSLWSWSNLYDPAQVVEAAGRLAPPGGRSGVSLELAVGFRFPGLRAGSSSSLPLPEEGWSALCGAAGLVGRGYAAADAAGEASGGAPAWEPDNPPWGESALPWGSGERREPSFTGRLTVSLPLERGALSLRLALASPVRLSGACELAARPFKQLVVTAAWRQEWESGAGGRETRATRVAR